MGDETHATAAPQPATGSSYPPADAAQHPAADAELARCLDVLADALGAPPDATGLARLAGAARTWPLSDAESRRGTALLAESRVAGETAARIRQDHDRLFVSRVRAVAGGPTVRIEPPLASPLAGDLLATAGDAAAAVSWLQAALDELGLAPSAQPDHIAVVLGGLAHALRAAASAAPATTDPPGARLRHDLVHRHLLVWGTRCLGRMQRGAQTFHYQGLAALGLGLLREVGRATTTVDGRVGGRPPGAAGNGHQAASPSARPTASTGSQATSSTSLP